jgi:dATP pyrophosphohydrolase
MRWIVASQASPARTGNSSGDAVVKKDTAPPQAGAESRCIGVIVHLIRGIGEDGRFLFLERSGGRFENEWWPVAGTCEQGEAPIETVLRELPEETGLTPLAVYAIGEPHPSPEQPGHLEIFVVPVPEDAKVVLNYEHSDFKWLTLTETMEFVPETIRPMLADVGRRFFLDTPPESSRVWPL